MSEMVSVGVDFSSRHLTALLGPILGGGGGIVHGASVW